MTGPRGELLRRDVKFAWYPIKAWYRHEYQWVWCKWYRPNSAGLTNEQHAVAEFEP